MFANNEYAFILVKLEPGMVGRYIKDSWARVRRYFILSCGWAVHAKEISN